MTDILTSDYRSGLRSVLKSAWRGLHPAKAVAGRLRYLSPRRRRFTGAFPSLDLAQRSLPSSTRVGYDHDEVATVAFERMCEIAPWDYPVIFWLDRLMKPGDVVVDAGGHMGTKFRAMRGLLDLDNRCKWIVYDFPALVRQGRRLAEQDGLSALHFVERLEDAETSQILLCSGLLQYLDIPFAELVGRLKQRPEFIILNKVAVREGPTVVTIERLGGLTVPYQIRQRRQFLDGLSEMGYELLDEWSNPSLAHVIDTHPELGASESIGMVLRKRS